MYLIIAMLTMILDNTFIYIHYPLSVNKCTQMSVSLKDYIQSDYLHSLAKHREILYFQKKNVLDISSRINLGHVDILNTWDTDKKKFSNVLNADFSSNFSMSIKTNKIHFLSDISYSFCTTLSSTPIINDEYNMDISFSIFVKGIKFIADNTFRTRLVNKYENREIVSSFLSPADIRYSLGIVYENKRYINKKVSIYFSSVNTTVFMNQGIYITLQSDTINEVGKGRHFISDIGMTFAYTLEKQFKDSFTIRNSGNIFIPNSKNSSGNTWKDSINANITNEFTFYKNRKLNVSIISRVDYNKYKSRGVELYSKLSVGIYIK